MSKEQTIAFLNKHGFTVIADSGDRVWLDSLGKEAYDVPIVQILVFRNSVGTFSIDINGGGFLAPLFGLERELLQYLDNFHPGWKDPGD